MLIGKEENEYELRDGTCWIEVGNLVMFIAHHPDCMIYEIYPVGSEMDSPIHADSIPFDTEETL